LQNEAGLKLSENMSVGCEAWIWYMKHIPHEYECPTGMVSGGFILGGTATVCKKKAKLHSENDESRPPRLEKMWYQVVFSNQEGEKTPQ